MPFWGAPGLPVECKGTVFKEGALAKASPESHGKGQGGCLGVPLALPLEQEAKNGAGDISREGLDRLELGTPTTHCSSCQSHTPTA